MIYLMTVVLLVFDWLAFIHRMDLSIVFIIAFAIIGGIRGVCVSTRGRDKSDIFNLKPYIFKIKTRENVIELVNAFLVSITYFNYDIISKKFGLGNFILFIVFACVVYRFIFYNFAVIVNAKTENFE